MNDKLVLLSLIELGGYPNFTPLYQQAGYEVLPANSVRKALGLLKKQVPDVIVAEFNFQTEHPGIIIGRGATAPRYTCYCFLREGL